MSKFLASVLFLAVAHASAFAEGGTEAKYLNRSKWPSALQCTGGVSTRFSGVEIWGLESKEPRSSLDGNFLGDEIDSEGRYVFFQSNECDNMIEFRVAPAEVEAFVLGKTRTLVVRMQYEDSDAEKLIMSLDCSVADVRVSPSFKVDELHAAWMADVAQAPAHGKIRSLPATYLGRYADLSNVLGFLNATTNATSLLVGAEAVEAFATALAAGKGDGKRELGQVRTLLAKVGKKERALLVYVRAEHVFSSGDGREEYSLAHSLVLLADHGVAAGISFSDDRERER